MTVKLLIGLSRLKPLDREVLIDVDLIGISQVEIAERLGVTAAAVYQRLRRARAQIAPYLDRPVGAVERITGYAGDCVGCGCELAAKTDGCPQCWDRERRRGERAAA